MDKEIDKALDDLFDERIVVAPSDLADALGYELQDVRDCCRELAVPVLGRTMAIDRDAAESVAETLEDEYSDVDECDSDDEEFDDD